MKNKFLLFDVMVIDLTWELKATNVINQLIGIVVEFNTITKIHKYRRFHEGHHFIPMAMEVHGAPERDMDCFIRECIHLFHNRQSRGHLSLSFCIQFFKHCVCNALQHALAFAIEKKIVLVRDVYSRPLITIKSHNLHVDDIRGVAGEIVSYCKRD
jgi:hypothetical protein